MRRAWRVGMGWLSLALCLAACGALAPSRSSQIPVGVPDFPGSVGSLEWASPEGITDVLEALPPAASAEALLTAAAERVAELRPDEEVRYGWSVAPAGESAGAWLHLTGTPDDSIAGEEIRMELEGVGGTWRVVYVESAIHCRRGIDAESQLCV